MLNRQFSMRPFRSTTSGRAGQRGVVLLVVLVVLVAMTLAAIALMRSVNTTNRIAGNLAFQQSATQAADVGIEAAVAWLETAGAVALQNNKTLSADGFGYMATYTNPSTGTSWESYWDNTLGQNPDYVNALPQDPTTGNTVSFVIQRLCKNAGDPATPATECAISPSTSNTSMCSKGGGFCPSIATQQYYRITVHVVGPRNTVSLVQAVVAI